jgi:hypothetical protein
MFNVAKTKYKNRQWQWDESSDQDVDKRLAQKDLTIESLQQELLKLSDRLFKAESQLSDYL